MTQRGHYSRGRERRDELIDAAITVIAARGVEGVTFRSVAAQAGFAPSTTSYFFATVDDVVEAALLRVARKVVDRVDAVVAHAQVTDMDADALADAIIGLVSVPEQVDTVAQFEAYLAVRRRPALGPVVEQISAAMVQACTAALSAFGVRDLETATRAFIALIDGFALHRVAGLATDASRDALRSAMFALLEHYQRPVGGPMAGASDTAPHTVADDD